MGRCHLMELPTELLFIIASHMDRDRTISMLSQTSRYFYYRLNEYLYKLDVRDGWYKAILWALLRSPVDGGDIAGRVARKSIQAGANATFWVHRNYPSLRSHDLPAVSLAALRDSVPLLQAFIDGGADINLTYPNRGSPLRLAVDAGSQETAMYLLSRPEIDLGPSRLVSAERAQSIWEAEGSILARAVLSDSQGVARILLTRVDPNEGNPIHLAIRLRNFEMVALLLSSRDTRLTDTVHKLCNEWHYEFCGSKTINRSRSRHLTPFALACFCSSLEIVRLLHNDARVDVDLCSGGRDSALEMVLVRKGRYCKREQKEILYFLIRSKKAKSARRVIFPWACQNNDYDLAREIIRVAGEHDRRDAKVWIEYAKWCDWDDLVDSICGKWDGVEDDVADDGEADGDGKDDVEDGEDGWNENNNDDEDDGGNEI